jgi:phospholipid/cholesterol/gamma-HCH transport system substrate-binding protein
METKANYVLVGLFTLIAIVAAFGFVYWTAAVGDRGETALLRVRIPGSAAGLGRGSGVLFNGVRVGDVERVYLDVNDPTIAIADARIDRLTPITRSTGAYIGIAGLTGQANIELRGARADEPKLLDEAEEQGRIAEITANPSAVTNLLQRAQDIFDRTDRVLSSLDGFVTDVRSPLTNTIRNTEKFSQALGDNAEGVDEFLASVTRLSDQLASASDKLDSTLDAAESLIRSVDTEQVGKIVDNVETLSANLSETSKRIDGVVARVDSAVQSITEFSDGAQQTLAKVDSVLEGIDPEAVRSAISNLDATLESAKGVLASVDQEKVRKIVDNVDVLTANLGEASNQLGGVVNNIDGAVTSITEFSDGARETLAEVDKVLEGVDPNEVRETIANIETASKNINTVIEDVSKVTSKFGERANDIDRIIADASELADRLNKASTRVDGILVKVDNLLGSEETKGLVTEASETLRSFKQVADTLNSRLGTITEGLARFSNQGLRDVDALVRDARRSITRIEEAVSDLSANPQRILSGGEGTVRQYDGRARR